MPDTGTFTSHTVTSYMRQQPLGTYSSVLRSVSQRFQKLQDEIASESVAGLEFEEGTLRRFNDLNCQVTILKDAFSALVTHLVGELDKVEDRRLAEVSEVNLAVAAGITAAVGRFERRQATFEEEIKDAVKALVHEISDEADGEKARVNRLTQDVSAVLAMMPRFEDGVRENAAAITDRFDRLTSMVDRVEAQVQSQVKNIDSILREEMDHRELQLKRDVTRQMESISRVILESDRRRETESTRRERAVESRVSEALKREADAPRMRVSPLYASHVSPRSRAASLATVAEDREHTGDFTSSLPPRHRGSNSPVGRANSEAASASQPRSPRSPLRYSASVTPAPLPVGQPRDRLGSDFSTRDRAGSDIFAARDRDRAGIGSDVFGARERAGSDVFGARDQFDSEAGRERFASDIFEALDRNGDGVLTREEFGGLVSDSSAAARQSTTASVLLPGRPRPPLLNSGVARDVETPGSVSSRLTDNLRRVPRTT